ncbi:hypothetical protein DB32_005736 [Sandaracinus amylolyticus]|uniref:Uncharacterized protein n=1 Tax=Sandaracinus amylolyticus TaxID=927083 RepID=A0A0F6W6B8_9BACT|nr:hypothetical protein DB32_005736 [Sandaracinus amylolyticus]
MFVSSIISRGGHATCCARTCRRGPARAAGRVRDPRRGARGADRVIVHVIADATIILTI